MENVSVINDALRVKGFFHLQIVDPDGTVKGDSGWCQNVVTNDGFNNMLAKLLGGISGSSQITHVNVGTGGAPATNATTLPNEVIGTGGIVRRASVSAATSSNSKAVIFTATLASANSFVTQSQNISNVGLFAQSTGGTLFAGNTFASSAVATNQNVNITYQINFA